MLKKFPQGFPHYEALARNSQNVKRNPRIPNQSNPHGRRRSWPPCLARSRRLLMAGSMMEPLLFRERTSIGAYGPRRRPLPIGEDARNYALGREERRRPGAPSLAFVAQTVNGSPASTTSSPS
jgi:hypothetical protein